MGSIDEVELQRIENARQNQRSIQPGFNVFYVLLLLSLILKIVADVLMD